MDKNTPEITIKDFYKGLASSPYTQDGAFADSRNLDVFNYPGLARGSYKLVEKAVAYGVSLTSQPLFSVVDPLTRYIYIITDYSNILQSTDNGTIWATHTYSPALTTQVLGFAIWKGCLFVARVRSGFPTQVCIDVQNLTSGTWYYTFKSFTPNVPPTVNGKYFVSMKGSLSSPEWFYIGIGNTVSSIHELTTFDGNPAGDGTTFNWEANAITIPLGYTITCMEELKDKMLLGTNGNQCSIFVWDKASTLFDFALTVNENMICSMLNIDDIVYVMTGTQGRLFYYQESGLVFLTKVPGDINSASVYVFPNGMACRNGRLIFAAGGTSEGAYNIYSLFNGVLNIENAPSNATGGTIGTLLVTQNNTLLVGWAHPSATAAYGIDVSQSSNYYTDYTSYFETLLYNVGSNFNFANYAQIEAKFSKVLASGDGIRIRYRTNPGVAWGTGNTDPDIIAVMDYATYGAKAFIYSPVRVSGIENIQLKVEFKGSAQLLELTLIPS